MFKVPDNQPDLQALVSGFTVVDEEGSPVPNPPPVTGEWLSDNTSAVELTVDPSDSLKANAHFGSPNADGSPAVANLTATLKLPDGKVVGVFGAQVMVTAGPAAGIQGGTLQLGSLSEETPTP